MQITMTKLQIIILPTHHSEWWTLCFFSVTSSVWRHFCPVSYSTSVRLLTSPPKRPSQTSGWSTGGWADGQVDWKLAKGLGPEGGEDDRALAQVAQRGCGVSISVGIQKPSGHGRGQPVLGGPAWAGGLDKMISRGRFQLQPFCDYLSHRH